MNQKQQMAQMKINRQRQKTEQRQQRWRVFWKMFPGLFWTAVTVVVSVYIRSLDLDVNVPASPFPTWVGPAGLLALLVLWFVDWSIRNAGIRWFLRFILSIVTITILTASR